MPSTLLPPPFATHSLTVRNCKIKVMEQGLGVPTLLLHGNPDSSDIWCDIMNGLSPLMRTLAPDLPGFGASTVVADFDFSLEGLAGFVDDLVNALGITQPLNLVVHDMGGPYGLAWAVENPHKLRSLVIMNTVFSPDYRWHSMARVWRTPVLGELLQLLTNRWSFARELRHGSRALTEAQIQQCYDRITPAMKQMVLRLYRAMDPKDFAGWDDRLRAIAAALPSLVLWGDHDPYVDKSFAERFGAQHVEHFSDCGHWVPAEASQRVVAQLLPFFAGAQGAP